MNAARHVEATRRTEAIDGERIRDGGRVASGGKERVSDLPAINQQIRKACDATGICRCQRRSGKNCRRARRISKIHRYLDARDHCPGRVGHLNLYRWRDGL